MIDLAADGAPHARPKAADGSLPLASLLCAEAVRYFGAATPFDPTEESVRARRSVMFVLSGYGWGPSRIGRALGYDHTTIRLGLARVHGTIDRDRELADAVLHLARFLP